MAVRPASTGATRAAASGYVELKRGGVSGPACCSSVANKSWRTKGTAVPAAAFSGAPREIRREREAKTTLATSSNNFLTRSVPPPGVLWRRERRARSGDGSSSSSTAIDVVTCVVRRGMPHGGEARQSSGSSTLTLFDFSDLLVLAYESAPKRPCPASGWLAGGGAHCPAAHPPSRLDQKSQSRRHPLRAPPLCTAFHPSVKGSALAPAVA